MDAEVLADLACREHLPLPFVLGEWGKKDGESQFQPTRLVNVARSVLYGVSRFLTFDSKSFTIVRIIIAHITKLKQYV